MPLMMCGHSSNGAIRQSDGKPICVACIGIVAGADVPVETLPDLTGRIASCSYGNHRDVPSSVNLAFFAHQPDQPTDRYYCGCRGWD